jgi:hypothetical protein
MHTNHASSALKQDGKKKVQSAGAKSSKMCSETTAKNSCLLVKSSLHRRLEKHAIEAATAVIEKIQTHMLTKDKDSTPTKRQIHLNDCHKIKERNFLREKVCTKRVREGKHQRRKKVNKPIFVQQTRMQNFDSVETP